MQKKIRILNLCHDLLDFDGSKGDIDFFLYRLKQYNIDFIFEQHNTWEEVDLSNYDFVYSGVCPQKYENILMKNLKDKIFNIKNYIEEDKIFLAIEQSFIFLGNDMSEKNEYLGILPIDIKIMNKYTIGNVLIESEIEDFKSKINGFINTRFYYEAFSKKTKYLGKILLGVDHLWSAKYEGLIYRNFYGTQLRGPILPRNYDFCDFLIRKLIRKTKLPQLNDVFEKQAKEALTLECENFINNKEQMKKYEYFS